MACENPTIDSNITETRFAFEECPGQLPTDPLPDWLLTEPNTYNDFGGNNTLLARTPISKSRQRRKGAVVDQDAQAGYVGDLTQTNMQEMLRAFTFADYRTKSSYTVTGTADDITIEIETSGYPSLNSTALDFTTLDIVPGEYIFIGGDTAISQFATAANNGFKRVYSVTASKIVIDKSATDMVADTGAGKTIMLYLARVLKNEKGDDIVKHSVQFERTLGSIDGLEPHQSEYVTGCVANTMTMTITAADKVTVDVGFMGLRHELRTAAEGLKPGNRPALTGAGMFNTSTDVKRMNFSVIVPGDANPDKLFANVLEGSIAINNNAQANKAVSVLGSLAISVGSFDVSGSLNVYFQTVEAIRAIQENADFTYDVWMVRKNGTTVQGIIIDMPLLAAGNGLAQVEPNQPIMLPIDSEAAGGGEINPDADHTILFCFFDTLPELADTL